MPGVPIIHLHTRSPSPINLSPSANTATASAGPVDTPTIQPGLKKKKSILKKMSIPITWGDEPIGLPSSTHQNKLHKHPPGKTVHFTPPPSAHSDHATIATSTDHTQAHEGAYGIMTGLPTPETTPVAGEKKAKKGSITSRLFGGSKTGQANIVLPPTPPHRPAAQLHSGSAFDTSTHGAEGLDPWHHHATYFPEYEPIHPPSSSIPGMPGVTNHATYFPTYTPIFHPSHPVHAYPSASGALAYALLTPEAEAAAHAQRVGHSIAVHYPDLPRFAEYQQQSPPSGGKVTTGTNAAWQSAKWGVEGWTGFGWTGEKLPLDDGTTFGAPMPKGVPIPKEGEDGKKGKGKNKKDGEGDAAPDGGAADDGEEKGKEAGEGEAGGEAAGGGGGGKSKNNKKKK